MIVGRGLLARSFASRFADRHDTLIFASGVSNSGETSASEFEREFQMLRAARRRHSGRLVYFGSCSVTDEERRHTPYARHKLAMEQFVLGGNRGIVVRLPQVVGHTDNPNTLTNFLYNAIRKGERFSIWEHAERNLIDANDVAAITEAVIEQLDPAASRVFTIASERSVSMRELVFIFERILDQDANFDVQDKGGRLHIDASFAHDVARRIGLDLGKGYAERLLRKYYGRS